MKAKALVVLESVFLGSCLLVLTPSVNPSVPGSASTAGTTTSMSGETKSRLASALPTSPASSHRAQPLAVWTCTTSWYGEDFDGQPTANGEIYDMYAETAAHPTLPLGSIVRVVNTQNHRSQIVRINDRGPYVEGRELDVSYEVARRLGFDDKGLAKVRVELLEVPSRPAPAHHN